MRRQNPAVLQRQPQIPGIGPGEWFTPEPLFRMLEEKYGPFTLDAAADESNAKCAEYFTESQDGRIQPWRGRVWCNPPYRDLLKWVRHAYGETQAGRCEVAVLLLPAHTKYCMVSRLRPPLC